MARNADEFVAAILAQIEKVKSDCNAAPAPSPANVSVTEKLMELQQLKAYGLLTDEESEAKRKELIAKL